MTTTDPLPLRQIPHANALPAPDVRELPNPEGWLLWLEHALRWDNRMHVQTQKGYTS